MPGTTFPPFPNDIPAHPLLVIDFELIKHGDAQEIDRLWEAATTLGFWYLKNHGTDAEVEKMFEMGAETMDLPLEEKMKYEQGDEGKSFGYKAAGAFTVDPAGNGDSVEFLNVSKNDALAWPRIVHREYPSTVNARMGSTIKPFISKSAELAACIIAVLNDRLGLPKGALADKHRIDEPSGCESRCIKSPPLKDASPDKVALSPHTDFGSLSILHNRTGGLQVLPPGSEQWQYIKPIPGHAVCNIGDALSLLSGGILHSNIHRVVTPPREQAKVERWSLVYFCRPYETVELNALVEESPMIAKAVAQSPDPARWHTGQTAKAWTARRNKYQRVNNHKGPDTWKASRGTEYNESHPPEVRAY
ncbi:hypothetical protein BC835DRAFT_1265438 [Cytidiella melzeri]|nr:hypothetical protein BC835DRAFT_1265438 [Cytidiella melzeri]